MFLAFVHPSMVLCAPQPESDPPAQTEQAPAGFDAAALLSSAGEGDDRRQAARAILRRFASDASVAAPRGWLVEEPAASLRLLLDAAKDQADAEALAAAVVRAIRDGSPAATLSSDARAACLAVLARSNDPAAAELLVRWLENCDPSQRPAVVEALVAMSGREDLGQSPDAWRQWLARNGHLPPIAWREMLATGLRDRAQRLARRERELLRALTDSAKRLYAALPTEERPAALTAMLADDEPAIRLAGTDLLLRDLERGVQPTAEVSAALVNLLDDPQPPIRQAAAVMVDRIVPEGSAARLSVALRRETNPDVAAVMLRAFRRSPDAAAIDAVLRWLEYGEPTRVPAVRAVLALLELGFEPTPGQASRILARIDAERPSSLTPAGVHVLVRLSDVSSLGAVRSLLFAQRTEIRRAAAEALAPLPGFVEDLLLAAEADPDLLQRAADAVAAHKPWAPALRRVAMLELRTPTRAPENGPTDRPTDRAAEILPVTATLASLLSVHERLSAAQSLVGHPVAIEAILGSATRPMFADGPAGDRDFARAQLLLGLPEAGPLPAAPAAQEPAVQEEEAPEPDGGRAGAGGDPPG
ncbi:MAG: hypothetical protein ACIAS6_13600 [Phycisphaerales bacterium JB060]